MAVSVTANLTTIWDCESVTGAVGNKPALETEILKEGSNSVDFTTSQTNTYAGFDGTIPNSGDLSGEHIRIWYTSITFPNMDSQVNHGLTFYISDGSNVSYWEIAGKDTYQGGWVNSLVYVDSTPDSNSGTIASTSSISEIGMMHRSGTGGSVDEYLTRPKNLINVWVDYFRYGDGLVGYGTSWGINDMAVIDSAPGVGYGIIEPYQGSYYLSGSLEYGRTSEQTTYSDDAEVIIFADANVNSTLYGLKFTGDTSVTSTFSINSSVINSAGPLYYLDLDDSNIGGLTFTNNSVSGASTTHFLASSSLATVTGNSFSDCGTIYPQGSTFETNSISNTSDVTTGSLYVANTNTISNISDITISNYSGSYGIYITSDITAGNTIDFNNIQLDDSGTDVYWEGASGDLTISLSNGSTAVSTGTGGGNIIFTTAAVSTTVSVKNSSGTDLQNARVYMVTEAGGPVSAGTIIFNDLTNSSGEVTESRSLSSAQPISGWVRMGSTDPFYKTSTFTGVIDNDNGLILNIQMILDQ